MTRTAAFLVALVPLLVACSSAQSSPPPATPEGPDNFASFGVGGLTPGAKVQISKNNKWLPGNVVRQAGPGQYQVHYDGFGPEWDETVAMDRIKPQEGGAGPAAPAARDYKVGDKVLVKMQNRLLLGDVVQQLSPAMWRVHYDGYGPEVAENVGPDRIRRPHTGASGHNTGDAVSIDVGGRVMAGKVLAVVAADRWIVRFDGFGPEYDQEVGADKVKDAAKPAEPPVATPPTVAAATPPDKGKDKGKDKDKDKGKDKDKDKDKAKPPEPPPVVAPSGPPQVGDAVVVNHHGTFHAAVVSAAGPGGALRIKYDSAGTSGVAEEEVPADRVSRLAAPQKGTPYAKDQKVFIEWHGMYFPGKVVKEQEKGQYRVRYDGTGPEADEILIAKRVRPRP